MESRKESNVRKEEIKGERDRLVVDNMPLVWSMVGRFSSSGKDKEELFQIGMIGLMQAIDRFDTTYDVRFSTYAVPLILGKSAVFCGMTTPSRCLGLSQNTESGSRPCSRGRKIFLWIGS